MIVRELINLIKFISDPKGLKEAESETNAFVENMNKILSKLEGFIVKPFQNFAKEASALRSEQLQAELMVQASLVNAGRHLGKTFEDLRKESEDLSKFSSVCEDEILRNLTSQMMRFTNIVGEQFSRAQKLTLEVTARLDPTMSSMKEIGTGLARALNNPAENLKRLKMLGIEFSDEVEKSIQKMWELGNVEKAQILILNELESKFNGSIDALKKSGSGAKSLQLAWDDLYKTFGEYILPMYKEWNKLQKEVVIWMKEHLSPTMTKSILIFWGFFAAIIALTGAIISFVLVGQSLSKLFAMMRLAAIAANTTILASMLAWTAWIIGISAVALILFAIFNDIYVWMHDGKSLIGEWLGPWEEMRKKISDIFGPDFKNNLKNLLNELKEFFINFLRLFSSDQDKRRQAMKNMIKGLISIMLETIDTMAPAITKTVDGIVDIIRNSIQKTILNIPIIGWLFTPINEKNKNENTLDKLGASVNAFFDPLGYFMGKMLNSLPNFQTYPSIGNLRKYESTNNINVTVPLTVPTGTPSQQQEYLKTSVEEIFDMKLRDITRNILDKPEVSK